MCGRLFASASMQQCMWLEAGHVLLYMHYVSCKPQELLQPLSCKQLRHTAAVLQRPGFTQRSSYKQLLAVSTSGVRLLVLQACMAQLLCGFASWRSLAYGSKWAAALLRV